MTSATTPQGLSPAIRADHCSRLTRIVMRILRQRLCESDQSAFEVASEVAEGLIDEYGGGMLYVPLADRRAGLTDHQAIEASLRQRLSPDALAAGGQAPAADVEAIARQHAVSARTVYRVLRELRTGAAVWG